VKSGQWTATIVAGHQHADQCRKQGLAHKDVKNEGRTDYVYENTRSTDKIADNQPGFLV
jgi:hypothetical protein